MSHRTGVLIASLLAVQCAALIAGCRSDAPAPAPVAGPPPAAAAATISVRVSGVGTGNRVSLVDQTGEVVTATSDGIVAFATQTAVGQPYRIALASVPSGLVCSVLFGTGTTVAAGAPGARTICGPSPSPGAFQVAGYVVTPRDRGTLLPLADGSALLVGGLVLGSSDANRSIERFDPASATWSQVAVLPFFGMAPVALDDGRVIVFAAPTSTPGTVRVFLYDPSTSRIAAGTPANALTTASSAIRLLDGRVMASNGRDVELYDPVNDRWTVADSATATHDSALALTGDGRVLFVGGDSATNAQPTTFSTTNTELFDPSTGHWTVQSPLPYSSHLARLTTLPDGRVLEDGGYQFFDAPGQRAGSSVDAPSRQTSVFDPATGRWTATGSIPIGSESTATLLPSGRVLAAGGTDYPPISDPTMFPTPAPKTYAATFLFDPSTNAWTSFTDMPLARAGHDAVLLASGKLLVAGGYVSVDNLPGNVFAGYRRDPVLQSVRTP